MKFLAFCSLIVALAVITGSANGHVSVGKKRAALVNAIRKLVAEEKIAPTTDYSKSSTGYSNPSTTDYSTPSTGYSSSSTTDYSTSFTGFSSFPTIGYTSSTDPWSKRDALVNVLKRVLLNAEKAEELDIQRSP